MSEYSQIEDLAYRHLEGWQFTVLNGKIPIRKNWQREQPLPIDEIKGWATTHNIGLRTGAISGVVVLDVDVSKGGIVPDNLPKTPTVETGGGGLHYYFAIPPGITIRNSAGKISPHVDVRGERGVIVFPGSIHPETNATYRWRNGLSPDEVELAEFPSALIPNIRTNKQRGNGKTIATSRNEAYVTTALKNEIEAVLNAPEGERNDRLNKAAFCLGGFSDMFDEAAVVNALLSAAIQAGLSEGEARATIENGIRVGSANPRTLPDIGSGTPKQDQTSLSSSPVIRNYTWTAQSDGDGKTILKRRALLIKEIEREVFAITNQWPRRIDSLLFADEKGVILFLRSEAELFAWLARQAPLQWSKSQQSANDLQMTPKVELLAHLQQTARNYIQVERIPHQPPMKNFYYAWRPPEDYKPDGTYLNRLMEFFDNAETDEDFDLIRAMFLTPVWGGLPGTRPAFCVMAADRGYGKSTLTAVLAELYGGIEIEPARKNEEKIVTRLLSENAITSRVARIDNIKGSISGSVIEGLITANQISGHRMYAGEASRPNTLTWVLTGNSLSLSRDIAERSFIIRLSKPGNRPGWREGLFEFIAEHKEKIIADAVHELTAEPVDDDISDRWQSWVTYVLCRCSASPADVIALNQSGRNECDDDIEEARVIWDAISDEFRGRRAEDDGRIFVKGTEMTEVLNKALNVKWTAKRIAAVLRTHGEAGRLPNIEKRRSNKNRGYEILLESNDHVNS